MAKPENWDIAALRSISDGVITANLKGIITFMNPAAETLIRWRQEEALGQDLSDVFHIINPETGPPIKSLFNKIVQEGITINQEDSIYLAQGDKEIPIAYTIAPMRDEKERIIGAVLTFRDITKHKQMIDELKANAAAITLENARLYNQAQQQLTERIQAEQKALEINDKLLILQHAGAAIASSLDLQQVLDSFVLEIVNLLGVKGCIILKWDKDVNFVMTMTSYGINFPHKSGAAGVTRSLSDFPWLKRTLIEEQIQQMTMSQPEDIEAELLTYMQEMHIKTLLILPMKFHQRIIGLIELMDDQVVRTFTSEEISFAQLLANQAASAITNAQLYKQAKKELAERQNVAKELRWVSARNQTIINAIPDSLFYLNRSGKILDFRLKRNLPLIYEKLAPGVNLGDAFNLSSNYKRQIFRFIEQALDSGEMQTFEFKLHLPEGDQDIEARLVAQGPNEVLAIIRDITKRKRAEEALKKSEANLRAIFNSSRQAFVLLDRHGEIQAFNEAAREGAEIILGITLQEGGSIFELVSEEDLANLKQIFNRVLAGETVRVEQLLNVGGTDNWFEYNYTPVFADDGQVIGVCFSTIDIDTRKRAVDTLTASEERLLKELESVLFTTKALVSDLGLTNLLEFITTQARHLTNSNGAIILLLDEAGQHLEVVRSGILKTGARLPIQGSLAESVIKHNESYISNQALSDERTGSVRKLLEPIEVRSLFCIQLKVRNKPQGVLLIWSQDEGAFIGQNTSLIHLFANQAALAIYNANLHIRNRELAIEHERQRLARDLHDTVSKSLFAIGMLAQAAVRRLDQNTNPKIQEAVKDIHQLSQTGLLEIRKQIYYLQPTTLADKHLNEALKQFCNTLRKQFGFSVELLIDPEIQLSTYQQENLYYIAKEALWNAVKHAGDTQAKIVLEGDEGCVNLLIVDEGSGFVVSNLVPADMVGLRSIQERAEILGGTFDLQSEPGSGTRITVQIPL